MSSHVEELPFLLLSFVVFQNLHRLFAWFLSFFRRVAISIAVFCCLPKSKSLICVVSFIFS